jgi:endonuclease/exonuclease/phosphatase family metal-dependent hydrolase
VKLRLVTYNIHRGVGTDGHLRLSRIAEVIRHYDPHIVCIQEVIWPRHGDDGRTQPAALAEAVGLPHAVVALNCHRRRGTYGNMTLSRFPIESHENIDLTMSFRIPRAALYTRVRAPRAPLHVFNLHLGLAASERLGQMRELVADTPRVVPDGEAVVYAGDMNDWRHRIYPRVLETAGFRCAVGDADDPGHATFPSRFPLGALDKVFVRGAVKEGRAHPSRLALARVASDHLPVIVDLDVEPR